MTSPARVYYQKPYFQRVLIVSVDMPHDSGCGCTEAILEYHYMYVLRGTLLWPSYGTVPIVGIQLQVHILILVFFSSLTHFRREFD